MRALLVPPRLKAIPAIDLFGSACGGGTYLGQVGQVGRVGRVGRRDGWVASCGG